MRSVLAIVLAVAIGAAITWLWTGSGGVTPATSGTARSQSVNFDSQADRRSAESSGLPRVAPGAASVAPASAAAGAPAADDATYYRMVAIAQSFPKMGGAARKITELHERFLLTPDGPSWERRTEQALRDSFRARFPDSVVEVTSVSCRSAGCEVQALGKPVRKPAPDSQDAPVGAEPIVAQLGDSPAGQSLMQEIMMILDLGDRSGFFITYRRTGPTPESNSP